MNLPRRHLIAVLIIGIFIALGTIYNIVVPVFEAPDEMSHYPVVAHLAQGGGLPVQRPDQETLWRQEGSQPPLYYALAAALTYWLDVSDLPQIHRINPHARVGIPLAHDNKNIIIHTDREAFPWRGAVLGVHLTRFFSLLLAIGTLLCTYALGRVVFPDQPVLAPVALAINAFIPMFVFISASVNNDNLVVFLSSLTLVLLVRLIQRGPTPRLLLLIGVVIGLACLTKLGALGLIPLAGLALVLREFPAHDPARRRSQLAAPAPRAVQMLIRARLQRLVGDYSIVLAPVLAIAGWWYVRNWQLYGDPTGLNAMLDIVGRRPVRPSLLDLLAEFEGLRINFWGLFGGVNVLLQPTWIYRILDALTIAAMIGAPVWTWRRWRTGRSLPWREIALLSAWMAIEFAALIRWTSETFASQGRLFFPALAPICCFLALGLLVWIPPRWQSRAGIALAGVLFALTVTAPFTVIKPAYARPLILTRAEIPASARPFGVNYGGIARLVAFEVDGKTVKPGEALSVTLYWEALKPTREDVSVFVQLIVGQDHILGQVDSYTGGGAYPTSMWSVGEVIPDRFMVPVQRAPAGPVAAYLITGLYRYKTGERLSATDPAGHAVLLPTLTRVKIAVPTQAQTPQHPLSADLAGRVRLAGYDLSAASVRPGAEITLTLHWQVQAELDRDYTVFIHLLDENDTRIGGADGPPLDDGYPTSFWGPGEHLADPHRLQIPADLKAGRYRIAVGLYDPASGARVPVLDAQGRPVADRVLLGELEATTP